jgi:hypothetical protein
MIKVTVEGEHVVLDLREAAGDERKVRLDLADAWHLYLHLRAAYVKADENRSARVVREQYKGAVEDEYVAPGEDVEDKGD